MAAIELEGLRETVRGLERLGAEAADLKDVFGRVGAMVAADAAALAPVRTGATRASIRPTRTKNKAAIRAGGKRAPQAYYQNVGYRRKPGLLFLERAADKNAAAAADQINTGLAALLARLT